MKVLGERNTENLAHFIRKARQFKIPDFQRAYAWDDSQIKNFLADIENVIETSKSHYFGSIVYFPDSKADFYTVIDGQQRITTTILFMTAIFHALMGHPDRVKDFTADQIQQDFLYDTTDEEDKIILRAATTDRDAFERILRKNKPTPGDEYKPLLCNYKKFFNYLSDKENLDPYVRAFEKFEVITVALDANDDNPQIIFENINSTGKPLEPGDKIRNFALMLKTEEAREHVYKEHWLGIENKLSKTKENFITDFFRNFIMAETSKWHSKDETYEMFKNFYKEQIPNHKISEIDDFYAKTKSQLENYLFVKFLEGEYEKFSFVKNPNFSLVFLNIDVRTAFLMSVLEKYKNGEITKEDTKTVFDYFERYIGRRIISGGGIKGLNKDTPSWAKAVSEKLSKSQEETTYAKEFIKHVSDISGHNYGIPSDSDLEYAITKETYSPTYTNYILATICDKNWKETSESLPPYILRGIYTKELALSIEYIMPQDLTLEWKQGLGNDCDQIHEEYLNKLSNITLKAYSSKYSERPFSEKLQMKNGFKDSPLYINQEIAEFDKWDLDSIKQREKWLQDVIKKTWKWSSKYSSERSDYDRDFGQKLSGVITNGKVLDLISDEITKDDVRGTKPQKVLIDGEEFDVHSWIDFVKVSLKYIASKNPKDFQNLIDDSDFSFNDTDKEKGGILQKPVLVPDTEIYFESKRAAQRHVNLVKNANAVTNAASEIKIILL